MLVVSRALCSSPKLDNMKESGGPEFGSRLGRRILVVRVTYKSMIDGLANYTTRLLRSMIDGLANYTTRLLRCGRDKIDS
jgi:hypothetical protein